MRIASSVSRRVSRRGPGHSEPSIFIGGGPRWRGVAFVDDPRVGRSDAVTVPEQVVGRWVWLAEAWRMAHKVVVTVIDDLDGTSAAETVSFGLDGVGYEIDLSEALITRSRRACWSSIPTPGSAQRRRR
jgi:hypothetical protein